MLKSMRNMLIGQWSVLFNINEKGSLNKAPLFLISGLLYDDVMSVSIYKSSVHL
jgi:hypothetical protein